MANLLERFFPSQAPRMSGPTQEGPTLDMVSGPGGGDSAAGPYALLAAGMPYLANMLKDAPVMSGATQTVDIDHSGWNVNFGSGGITSRAEKTTAAPDTPVSWVTMIGALVAVALVVRAWKG